MSNKSYLEGYRESKKNEKGKNSNIIIHNILSYAAKIRITEKKEEKMVESSSFKTLVDMMLLYATYSYEYATTVASMHVIVCIYII